MKRFYALAALAAMILSGCEEIPGLEEGEKVYTEEELGVIVEWVRSGWDEVKNETDQPVTLITSYLFDEDVTSEILPGESVKLDIGAALPGTSIPECSLAVIRLADGSEIVCVQNGEIFTPWAERFFTNYEKEETYEIVDMEGKPLRHDLIILTHHIDQTIIDLWEESLLDGNWPAIQLDKQEVVFPSEGGMDSVAMLNYSSWWINGGYSAAPDEEGVWRRIGDYFYASSSDGAYTYDILEGDWFHAFVPDKGMSNKLIISADANILACPRYAIIEMECGDVFTTIKLFQP